MASHVNKTSLRTKSKSVATQRLAAHTQAVKQPYLNLTIAKDYLSAKSPEMLSRTWGEIMTIWRSVFRDQPGTVGPRSLLARRFAYLPTVRS
jgi:hypothetical protein